MLPAWFRDTIVRSSKPAADILLTSWLACYGGMTMGEKSGRRIVHNHLTHTQNTGVSSILSSLAAPTHIPQEVNRTQLPPTAPLIFIQVGSVVSHMSHYIGNCPTKRKRHPSIQAYHNPSTSYHQENPAKTLGPVNSCYTIPTPLLLPTPRARCLCSAAALSHRGMAYIWQIRKVGV